MKKLRYTEEQIAYALRQAETGTPLAEVIRRMGVLEQTYYRWKSMGPDKIAFWGLKPNPRSPPILFETPPEPGLGWLGSYRTAP